MGFDDYCIINQKGGVIIRCYYNITKLNRNIGMISNNTPAIKNHIKVIIYW